MEDITGQKFGRLTAIRFVGRDKHRSMMWECRCDCGNLCIVNKAHLKDGHTKSCGCYKTEKIKNLNYKNGKSNSKINTTYRNMLNRCYNKNVKEYKYYGARGISVCDEWRGENGFVNFCNWAMLNGYNESLSLDRINNNGIYEPNNCRWTTMYEQANNKRTTKRVSINGEIDTVARLSRKYNISYWNLLHYAKGGKNCKYPNLTIKRVDYE